MLDARSAIGMTGQPLPVLSGILLLIAVSSWCPAQQSVSGKTSIRRFFDGSDIVVTTTDRCAGAIESVQWKGKEFIDSVDHGRELQSAASFDAGSKEPFWAERYNPTEAGSRRDGIGQQSSSRLLSMQSTETSLQSKVQMAFWLAPGEESFGRPAINTKVLSDVTLQKRVHLGYRGMPNVIDYSVVFHLPHTEKHQYAQWEALTGYMPEEFSELFAFDTERRVRVPLNDEPGEQSLPVIFATKDGQYAMGIYSPDQPSRGFEKVGYGRFRFRQERVVKWNCVFRNQFQEDRSLEFFEFQMFVVLGTIDQVCESLDRLIQSDQ